MATNNDVFQILVVDPAKAMPAAGASVTTLTEGQIGIFDANTNLAVDGTSPVREFYVAVGVDTDGDAVVDAHYRSAGQVIQTRNIRAYSFREHSAAQPMIVELSAYSANCDTDYGLKLEFRNMEIYRRQGFNQFSKTYTVRTSCCQGCEDCPSGDCNELTQLLVNNITADEDNLVTAVAIATEALTIATHGTSANYSIGDVVSDADLTVLIAYNAAQADPADRVCTGVRVTTNALGIKTFCNVNTSYYYPRGMKIIPSLVEGFSCNGTLTTTQELAYEEGNGYDVRQKEYHAGGWNGRPGPYRVNQLTGLAKDGFNYQADVNAKYDVVSLTYDQFSVAGWGEHLNNLNTQIAFPTTNGGSTTAIASFLGVLDLIVADLGFDALANDAAAADDDPAVVVSTSSINDTTLDGIG